MIIKIFSMIQIDSNETQPKILMGLALGGGAARGWTHIGALKALKEANIEIDILAGSSIGALVGAAYLAGKLDILENWALSLNKTSLFRYIDFRLGGNSFIRGERLNRVLKKHLEGLNIEDLSKRFLAVSTEMGTGHEIWLREGALVPALRASFALPGAFPPIQINNRWMIDGALVNPIPVSVCRAFGARLVIAVGLNGDAFGPVGYSKNYSADDTFWDGHPISKHMPKTLIRKNKRKNRSKKPGLSSVLMATLNIVMDRLSRSRLAADPPDIYILPPIGHIGLMEFNRAEEMIELGYQAMNRQIPDILSAKQSLNI